MEEYILVLAYFLDFIIGDPNVKLHPVVLIGNYISVLESKLYSDGDSDNMKFYKGVFLNLFVLTSIFVVTSVLMYLAIKINLYFFYFLSALLISSTISTRGLKEAAKGIYLSLEENDLDSARKKVGYIVGRDTHELDESEITRATVETVSENIVDGVTSPLFYAFIGGAPLAFLYRAVNTLDSMVGYRNERYLFFGRFSARMDDVFNYIPARITSLIIITVAFLHPKLNGKGALKMVFRDAKKHPSPNGGYTESAVAGALNIRLGGVNSYFGKKSFREYMGDNIEQLSRKKIFDTIEILYSTTLIWVIISTLISFL